MPPVGFEPTISADERPQTYALDRAATGTCYSPHIVIINYRDILTRGTRVTAVIDLKMT